MSGSLILPETKLISVTKNCLMIFVRCNKCERSEYLPMLVLSVLLCISCFYIVCLASLHKYFLIDNKITLKFFSL